ncbi:hypothetical protein LWF01_18690 [Saxibacter everestensis]|uniref:Tetratricopeptide repeat protein n=1 Tax=Saxibacter everestensis TaxID=2909229 RepID=A0ABY8QSX5_9MICO|nr:hypothetical protein LWF01_18690 [Brevibacteriaceae bacterium ZFBP1038]
MDGMEQMDQMAPTHDEMMFRIQQAIELGQSRDRAEARERCEELWAEIGSTGDPLHRCVLAHHAADLQDDIARELDWDQRALQAAGDLTDDRAQQFDEALQVRGFLPSLHLNLADVYNRLRQDEAAREHLQLAEESLSHLPDDGYGRMIQGGVDKLALKLGPC